MFSRLYDCALKLGETPPELDALERVQTRFQQINHDDPKPLIKLTLRLGERYQKRQDQNLSQHYFQQVLDIDPHHLWANLKMAIATRNAGHFDAAESRLKLTVKHHPQRIEPLIHLGKLEYQRQNSEVAIEYFQQALHLQPDRFDISIKILEILRQSQRFEEAEAYLKTLESQDSNHARLLIQNGLLKRQQGQREDALQQFQQAYNIALTCPERPSLIDESHWYLIEELQELGRLDDAKQSIETASDEFRGHIRTQMLLGRILQRQEQLEAAITIYQQILQTQPDHVQATIKLARCWSQVGLVSEAIALLRDAMTQRKEHPDIILLLAHLHQSLHEFDQAQHLYEQACISFPDHSGGHCGLAECLFQKGDYNQAIGHLSTAQQALPWVVQLWKKQAQLTQRLGDVQQSDTILAQAQTKFPNNISLLLHISQFHIRCGAFSMALAILDLINTDQHNWCKQIEQQRGNIASQQYNFHTAEAHYRQAIALPPPTHQERNQLARVVLLQGQIEEAYHQLELATDELEKKRSPGQMGLPIKNHVATVINEFRMNPPMMAQLQEAQEEEGRDRLLALGSLLVQEPTFLGTAIYLAKELRVQGIFDQLQQVLSSKDAPPESIPKRIVQFWDDPQPPKDVEMLGQTWVEQHPDYEYKRFSLGEAIAFLQQHYDDDVLQAFRLCSHAATQADFFRLAYLNQMGGFYADADDRCLRSLEELRSSNAELILFQEDFACLGNNFLGCVPGQPMIRAAFYQAVDNLLNYSAEWAWSQTGPGLLTSVVCSGLLPYLASSDYRLWPRLWVMTKAELTSFVWVHVQLAYKGTEKSWQSHAYPKTQLSSNPEVSASAPKKTS